MKYHCYFEALRKITLSAWEKLESFDLAGLRKKIGDNLQDKPGMPEKIFLPSEMQAAEMRANIMRSYSSDLVVTLVCRITYVNSTSGGLIHVESVLWSQLESRITELRTLSGDSILKPIVVFSEETGQIFYCDGMEYDREPRLPAWGKTYDRKRKAYRKD